MHTQTQPPTECAHLAADAIRDLIHRTKMLGDARGYQQPSDVYSALGALVELLGELPQAIHQLSQWLDNEIEHQRVASVSGWPYAGDPIAAGVAIDQHIYASGQALAVARDHLSCAFEAAGGLATAHPAGAR